MPITLRSEAVNVAGIPVHPVCLDELLAWIERVIAAGEHSAVMYANIHAANLARSNVLFRAAVEEADIVFCDGQGLRLGALLLGYRLPARFTPPDWIDRLVQLCARYGWRIALVGAAPGVAGRAAERLQEQTGLLETCSYHGYFAPGSSEEEQLVALLKQFRPDIVLVGMGMPRQEIWAQRMLKQLPPCVIVTVGALFDYIAGVTPRGPRWLTDNGLEWLCRLWFEPQRLWRRYLLGNPAFFFAVLRQRLRRQQSV